MSLILKNVKYVYAEDSAFAVSAVNDVSFTVEQGEVVGLVGHTGSGKSTLAQLICGLLPADSGEIHHDDLQLVGKKKLKAQTLVQRVGMVFQYPEYQLFEETVEAELAYGPLNLEWEHSRIDRAINDVMKSLQIDESFLRRNPLQLSGGEKRKIALASVLVMNPRVLVLDEPFVGLDCVTKDAFTELLLSWQRQNQATIICISHDMDQLAVFCERLLVMNRGELIIDAPIEAAFRQTKQLAAAGILQPVPKELLLTMAAAGCAVDTDPITIDGAARAILDYLRKAGEPLGK